MKRLWIWAFALTLWPAIAGAQNAATCDRACLAGFMTQYLDAMVAHKPSALPVASDLRVTENTVTMPLGEGLWKTASKLRTYRMDFLDVAQGVAASHVVLEESGMPAMLGLRIKIVEKKITEVETIVTRSRAEGALFTVDTLQTPKPAMTMVPDKSQRMSRAELIRIAEFYPAGLKVGGTFEAVNAPFYGAGNALTMFEAFKVYGGQIHAVEAFMRVQKANTPSGWDDRYEVKKPK